ncbi:hypothetical protein NPIL_687491 [Nephila pilipes]|uniref:Uncharacterized protein n=1 Tax=Nephila pilipes TaxID=299642 RepID=A0A8X6NKL1_NEPPI|nr:hypothetical protein NPIL_687491 [Nephila pilipes]
MFCSARRSKSSSMVFLTLKRQTQDDDGDTVDIVELHPDKVDTVSDIEDNDASTLEDNCPRGVPGRL